MADGKCDWFYAFASSVMEAANGRYCKILSPVGSPFFDTTISYILPKSSNLTEVFSMETLKLREEGKLETARNLANKRKCPSVTDPTMVGTQFVSGLELGKKRNAQTDNSLLHLYFD